MRVSETLSPLVLLPAEKLKKDLDFSLARAVVLLVPQSSETLRGVCALESSWDPVVPLSSKGLSKEPTPPVLGV